jgi:putative tryptophan/tyrosine transport system substrate-binding protein
MTESPSALTILLSRHTKRREFIAGLGAAAWPMVARAQAPKNVPRLCFLTFDPVASRSIRFGPFFDALRDLGYVDGDTIAIDYLSTDGRGERFPDLAAECLRLKADIIAVSTTPATRAAKSATRTIPIVMIALGDPVGTGLVDSLPRPGGNVTGMSMMVPELATKRLELLIEAVPKISRVLVLTYLADPIAPLQVNAMEAAAIGHAVNPQITLIPCSTSDYMTITIVSEPRGAVYRRVDVSSEVATHHPL